MAALSHSQVEFIDTSYGKTGVKILYVKKNSSRHEIYEYEVSTLLWLNDRTDYIEGNNKLVVPTDTQKNTVYAVAQKYGVGCPEEFAMVMCKHFLQMYSHVNKVQVRVHTVNGWKRLEMKGQEHNHAFMSNPICERFAEVTQCRGEAAQITAGVTGLRVLKTTQSGFVDFHRCPYTTLNDTKDRILSTVVSCHWRYNNSYGLDFNKAWDTVLDCIMEWIAGNPSSGLYSPSVQQTMYDIERSALARVPQMGEIHMALPNVHYFEVDMTRFKDHTLKNTKNVYLPTDKPSGYIKASLKRKPSSKL